MSDAASLQLSLDATHCEILYVFQTLAGTNSVARNIRTLALHGLRFNSACMSALVRLLKNHTQIMSLNLGEKGSLCAADWDLLATSIETHEVGVVFVFVDKKDVGPAYVRRIKDAVKANQMERQRRALSSRTKNPPLALRICPWRDHALVERMKSEDKFGTSTEAAFGRPFTYPGKGLTGGKQWVWWPG